MKYSKELKSSVFGISIIYLKKAISKAKKDAKEGKEEYSITKLTDLIDQSMGNMVDKYKLNSKDIAEFKNMLVTEKILTQEVVDTLSFETEEKVIETEKNKKYGLQKTVIIAGAIVAVGLLFLETKKIVDNYIDLEVSLYNSRSIKTEALTESEKLVMSENAMAFENQTLNVVNELLINGINYKETKLAEDGLSLENIELVESDKEVYAEMVAKYRLVANQKDITNSEWAGYLGETSYSALDLTQNFYNVNNMLKNNLFGMKSDNQFDFSTLFDDEEDAKLLNGFQSLVAEFNEAKTNDKEDIAIKIKAYVVDNLTSTTGEFKYSNEAKGALNSLLSAYVQMTNSSNFSSDAKLTIEEISVFFTLEEGCDQYKESLNSISTEESTQAMNIMSEITRKQEMMESFVAIIENNEFNSITYIIDQVAIQIDLNIFKEKEVDSVESQLIEKGIIDKEGKYVGTDVVNDPNYQLDSTGTSYVNTGGQSIKDYEESVKAAEDAKSDATAKTTMKTDAEIAAELAALATPTSTGTTTSFEDTPDAVTGTTTTVDEQGYTEPTITKSENSTTYLLDGSQEITTTNYYSDGTTKVVVTKIPASNNSSLREQQIIKTIVNPNLNKKIESIQKTKLSIQKELYDFDEFLKSFSLIIPSEGGNKIKVLEK